MPKLDIDLRNKVILRKNHSEEKTFCLTAIHYHDMQGVISSLELKDQEGAVMEIIFNTETKISKFLYNNDSL